jgi:hypothetical protein
VWDAGGRNVSQSFTINVEDANDAPVVILAIGDRSLNQGDVVDIDASLAFSDPDGDVLTYSATGLPPNLVIDSVTGIVSGTLDNADVGVHAVSITADDGNLGTVSDSFTLTVNDIADAPQFDSTPLTTAREGVAYSYAIVASDPDLDDTLVITAPTIPGWLNFTDNGDGTASLSGTPAASNVGVSSVILRVTDGDGTFVEQPFSITVSAIVVTPPPPSGGGGAGSPLLLMMLAGILTWSRRKRQLV